jgi:hypothetical protein
LENGSPAADAPDVYMEKIGTRIVAYAAGLKGECRLPEVRETAARKTDVDGLAGYVEARGGDSTASPAQIIIGPLRAVS